MDGHIKRLTLVSNLVDTNTLITLPTPLETPAPSTSTTSTFPNPVRQANPRLSLAFSRRNSSALLPGALYLPPSSPRSPLSPTRTPPRSPFHGHVRRSTYAGDISPGFSRPPMLNVEEKIAILESTNKRLSIELAETKDALSIEREGQVSHASSRRSSQRSPSPSGHDLLHEAEQLHHERNLRVEVLDSLKKVRTYNGVLSRSIREHQEQSESLASLLEEERTHREMAQDEIAKIERVNFTLYEHNRLLVARDLAFQRMTDSVHPEPSPCISQDASSSILGSHQPLYALRNDLNAARDELHIVKMDLNASEEARAMLSERVTALQREMSHCLDSSSQALQTERELRDEVLERLRQKEDEVEILQRKLQGREEKVPVKNNDSATLDRQTSHLNSSVCFRQRVHKRLERRRQRRTRLVTLPCSQPRDETILSPENSLSRLSSPSLLLSILTQQNLGSLPTKTFGRPSTQRIPSVIKQILVSPTSTVSTLVCSSNVTSLAVDAKPHRSVLLSATLSRKLGKSMKAEALKADSTCSIDVMTTNGYGHTDAHSVSQHAFLALTNLALQDSGWEVVDGPVIM